MLCADDYAMTAGVSRGILRLLEAERISATGAMTNRPFWREGARELRPLIDSADLGVHLNLTCGAPLTAMHRLAPNGELPRLPRLLAGGIAGRLPLAEIAAEFAAQLDAYEDAMGRVPAFIDGHQHVHAMPGVRRALADVLDRRYVALQAPARPYIRDAADSLGAIRTRAVQQPKALLVAALTRPFASRLRAFGFRLNQGFSGYSAFDPRVDYGREFACYLAAPGDRHLIMCHPGEVDDELRRLDPAVESRFNELTFFLSPRFEKLCAAAGMRIGRFAAL